MHRKKKKPTYPCNAVFHIEYLEDAGFSSFNTTSMQCDHFSLL